MSLLHRRWRHGLAAALPCLGMLAAQAAPSDNNAAFARLLTDPAEQRQVIAGAGRSSVMLRNPCADARFAIEKKFVPYQPVRFDGDGRILAGAWKQSVGEQGCGVSRVLNVIVVAQEGGKLGIVPVLPGASHADPILQQDALKIALQAAATVPGGREADCTVSYVADTEYLGEEGETLAGAKGRPWKERWTLQSCTQKLLIPMRFIPDPSGTSISAGPSTAIEIVRLEH